MVVPFAWPQSCLVSQWVAPAAAFLDQPQYDGRRPPEFPANPAKDQLASRSISNRYNSVGLREWLAGHSVRGSWHHAERKRHAYRRWKVDRKRLRLRIRILRATALHAG